MKHVGLIALFLLCSSVFAMAGETSSPPGAKVYFVNLADGATVSSPVKVVFGLSRMGVAPAGTEKVNTGHHRMLIDRPALGKGPDGNEEFDANIPSDEHHVHFGKGQTETTLTLTPGKHILTLQFADGAHQSYGYAMRQSITVHVE